MQECSTDHGGSLHRPRSTDRRGRPVGHPAAGSPPLLRRPGQALYARDVEVVTASSAASAANAVLQPALPPVKLRNAQWKCLVRASARASCDQELNAEAIPTLLVRAIAKKDAR